MQKTPLYDWHVSHGARIVDFAGWQMPIQYTSITDEHHAVRKTAGLFDIAHMGRLTFSGPDAETFLDRLLTNDVTRLKTGQVRYSLVCNEQGGILDDVLIYRLPENWMLVVNASNREKILGWIESRRASFDVEIHDRTAEWFMLALQGPESVGLLSPAVSSPISSMKYYSVLEADVFGLSGIISRTGYTGEDGYEVIVPAQSGVELWEKLYDAGQNRGLKACGLGCRDTLRLEAAMPLYGHEMDETVDPFTAGLDFGVKLNAGDFVGKQALLAKQAESSKPKRVGIRLDGKRIAREGSLLFSADRQIGRVTSGTFSPTLDQSIAMAYVEPGYTTAGTSLEVEIRGKRNAAAVVELPFYRRG